MKATLLRSNNHTNQARPQAPQLVRGSRHAYRPTRYFPMRLAMRPKLSRPRRGAFLQTCAQFWLHRHRQPPHHRAKHALNMPLPRTSCRLVLGNRAPFPQDRETMRFAHMRSSTASVVETTCMRARTSLPNCALGPVERLTRQSCQLVASRTKLRWDTHDPQLFLCPAQSGSCGSVGACIFRD